MTLGDGSHFPIARIPSVSKGVDASATPSLTQADVCEFQLIMRDECGIVLDDAEAWQRATELTALFRMLLGPIPEDPAFEPGSNVVAVAPFEPGKLS